MINVVDRCTQCFCFTGAKAVYPAWIYGEARGDIQFSRGKKSLLLPNLVKHNQWALWLGAHAAEEGSQVAKDRAPPPSRRLLSQLAKPQIIGPAGAGWLALKTQSRGDLV